MGKHDDAVSIPFDASRNGQETSEERLVRTFNELKDSRLILGASGLKCNGGEIFGT